MAGGYVNRGPHNLTEVVELIKTNSTPSFGQLPITIGHAVGAMLGSAPIICGGHNGYSATQLCVSFENSQWSHNYLLKCHFLRATNFNRNGSENFFSANGLG